MSRRTMFLVGIPAAVLGFIWLAAFREHQSVPNESHPASNLSLDQPGNNSESRESIVSTVASISGTARFEDSGAPAAQLLVEVYCEKSDRQFRTTTNDNGDFTIPRVDANTDLLWRAKEGETWLKVIAKGTRLTPGEKRSGVEIIVQRPIATSGVSGTIWDTSNVNRRMLELAPKLFEAEQNENETYANEIEKNLERTRTPLPTVTIRLKGASLRRETATDVTGCYAFTDLPEGRYTIQATPPNGAAVERASRSVNDKDLGPGELRVELGPGEIKNNVDFQFRFDTAVFTGHVRDAAGNPITGAEITATIMEQQAEIGPINKAISLATTSASDGSYRVDGLLPFTLPPLDNPRYEVTARAKGYVSQHVHTNAYDEQILIGLIDVFEQMNEESEDGESEPGLYLASLLPRVKGNTLNGVDFTLHRNSSIAGKLVDPKSNPIVGSLLTLTPLQRQETPRDSPFTREPVDVTSGPKGEFSFVEVSPGAYDIRAEIGGAVVRTKHSPLLVLGGEEISGIRVVAEVQTPGSIEGHVITEDGRRINGDYSVHVEPINNPLETRPRLGRLLRDPTDPQKFYLDDISPGSINLSVDAPGYATAKIQSELTPGATVKLNITLSPESVLHVFVTQNGEHVEEGSSVSVVQVTDGMARGLHYDASNQADKDTGYHKFTRLAGQYDVTAIYGDGALYREQRTRISLPANAVTEVTIDLLGGNAGIRGTLFGEDKPGEGEVIVLDAAEAVSEVYPFDRSKRAAFWMNKPPRVFEVDGLPAGTYRVIGRFGARGERHLWEEREKTVTLRDGEIKKLDFEG